MGTTFAQREAMPPHTSTPGHPPSDRVGCFLGQVPRVGIDLPTLSRLASEDGHSTPSDEVG